MGGSNTSQGATRAHAGNDGPAQASASVGGAPAGASDTVMATPISGADLLGQDNSRMLFVGVSGGAGISPVTAFAGGEAGGLNVAFVDARGGGLLTGGQATDMIQFGTWDPGASAPAGIGLPMAGGPELDAALDQAAAGMLNEFSGAADATVAGGALRSGAGTRVMGGSHGFGDANPQPIGVPFKLNL